jgi:hypothetical protein
MGDNDRSFPKIAESNWWKLRDLFKQKVPALVTSTYLSSALSMNEDSARSNLITPFKKLGILDETGKPSDLAYDWRDDSKYPDVCKALLEKIYPQEVRDLYASIDSDPNALKSWFMNYCRCGESAAKMYTTFYRLLLRSDPSHSIDTQVRKSKKSNSVPKQLKVAAAQEDKAPVFQADEDKKAKDESGSEHKKIHKSTENSLPQLHINIQLHISPESTPDQIDKIFESMARHLKDFRI